MPQALHIRWLGRSRFTCVFITPGSGDIQLTCSRSREDGDLQRILIRQLNVSESCHLACRWSQNGMPKFLKIWHVWWETFGFCCRLWAQEIGLLPLSNQEPGVTCQKERKLQGRSQKVGQNPLRRSSDQDGRHQCLFYTAPPRPQPILLNQMQPWRALVKLSGWAVGSMGGAQWQVD